MFCVLPVVFVVVVAVVVVVVTVVCVGLCVGLFVLCVRSRCVFVCLFGYVLVCLFGLRLPGLFVCVLVLFCPVLFRVVCFGLRR